ncbi:MAG TPA: DNRLRE domain-containing protein [Lacipirellulaceae bacterium]|nr:DNRLRE domain-containing protein [Lacipirellulaceae bacterium]
MKPVYLVASLLVVLLVPQVARPITVTIGAMKDNTIFQSNSNNSAGGSAGIFSGANGQSSTRRGLIAFDIAGNVPAGSVITGAQLSLYLGNAPNSNVQTIGLYKLTKNWGEGTAGSSIATVGGSGAGFPASPGDATWSDAEFGSVPWSSPGGTGDFDPVASATAFVGGPVDTQFTWTSTTALIDDVQSWLDDSATNFGWVLVNANESTNQSVKAFYSREATQDSSGVPNSLDPSWRPSLAVTYETPTSPTGDYNGDGIVDAADYVVWRKTLDLPASPEGSGADGNRDGTIDSGDFTFWRNHFGEIAGEFQSSLAVPEPATVCLLIAAVPLAFSLKRR